MENPKNICTNCGKELGGASIFCSHCGTKQTIIEETSIITSEPRNPSMSSFKDKMKNLMRKYHLIPSDIIAIVGAFITLLGVYVFNFLDITLPFLGHQSSTLAGSIKLIKKGLGLGEYLGSVSSMVHQLKFFIAAMTILPLVVIICTFINKKITKIISGVAALLVTILFLTLKFNLQLLQTRVQRI